jgi:hypothetical protein
MTYSKLYGQAGLTYIRFEAPVETKPNGQKKIGGSRPAFSKIVSQPTYGKGDGRYYSLLMGREIKPGRFVILLDFDNKADETSKTGLELINILKVDERGAPEQSTPSGDIIIYFMLKPTKLIKSPPRRGSSTTGSNTMLMLNSRIPCVIANPRR